MSALTILTYACTVVIAHYVVVFLEPSKASWIKAIALAAVYFVANEFIRSLHLDLHVYLRWVLYIALVTGIVWGLYRLKPLNNLTVSGCYVVGRLAIVYVINVLTLQRFGT